MDDKCLMQDLLLTAKNACNLYLHGTIEAGTAPVHGAFDNALTESLKMQEEIYKKMEQKGWYPASQVEQQKIDQLKQQYSN